VNITECIEKARKAHVALRSRAGGTCPDEQSSLAYKTFKTAVNQLWAETPQLPNARDIRSSLWRLTIDAEFFAGLNDSEGFRDATEVWQQYTYLKQAVDAGNEAA
jgi:hypothetical protein